jgi:hypothetical protein
MADLLTDDQGIPKPQIESEDGSNFESLKGKLGAQFSYTKDGHNETLGSMEDAEVASGNGSLIGIVKALRTLINTLSTTLAGIKTKTDNLASLTDTVRNSPSIIGSSAVQGAVAVSTSVIELKVGSNALSNRKHIKIFNTDATNIVYVGFTNTVSTANGVPVFPKSSLTLELVPGSAILVYAISTAATDVRIIEA